MPGSAFSRAPLTESKAIPLAKGTPLSAQEDPGRLRSTFDGVASLYDEVRPGYPERLFDNLASISGTGPGTRALELGCGTGQATLPLARRGYRILGVELSANLAAMARTKLADYPNARVLACSFEEWPLEKGAFDLVVSATAFHWVDPLWSATERALKPCGRTVRLRSSGTVLNPRVAARASRKPSRTSTVARRLSSLQSGGPRAWTGILTRRDRTLGVLREARGAGLLVRGGPRCRELPAVSGHLLEPQGSG
jgi:SAM-dependent methyltransferase